jgi:hypothetical protein
MIMDVATKQKKQFAHFEIIGKLCFLFVVDWFIPLFIMLVTIIDWVLGLRGEGEIQ